MPAIGQHIGHEREEQVTVETAIALIGFAFVMSITPGPSNFLLLASGANFGFVRSLPLAMGISTGFLTMVFCVGLGLGKILEQNPAIYNLLRIGCGVYVLWLAWQIARSRSLGAGKGNELAQPIGFIQAAMFQWVNPKAWAVALIVTVSYTRPGNFLSSLVSLIALFAVVNLPSISVWALSGAALRQSLSKGRRIAVFNLTMALLLVASMIPVLLST